MVRSVAPRFGLPTVANQLYQYGKRVASGETVDPTFCLDWFEAADPADFASARASTPENEYRTKRLNQWVVSATAWLPHGAWDACRWRPTDWTGTGPPPSRVVDPAEKVVLAFDGSWTNDSTGITGCTVTHRHPFTVAVWEPAINGEPVESQSVEDRLWT